MTHCRPATPSNVRRLLQAGSVGLLPGGIAELFLCDPDRECVYLKHRKGFIKMAIEHGASLVPVREREIAGCNAFE